MSSAAAATTQMTAPRPRSLLLRGVWWTIKSAGKALLWTVAGVVGAAVTVVRKVARGEQRAVWRAVAVVALGAVRVPGAVWVWAVLAAVVAAVRGVRWLRDRKRPTGEARASRRVLSDREAVYVAATLSGIAAWHALPWLGWYGAALYVMVTAPGLTMWCRSRWLRAAVPDAHTTQWNTYLSDHPRAGVLTGTHLEHDPDAGRYRLTSPEGSDGDAIAKADGHACSLLSRAPGTVTISRDPEGTANDFLVAFTDRQDGTVVRYADGPTLTSTGIITPADAADGREIHCRLFTEAGAAHILVLATNRYGKGVLMRLIGVEVALWNMGFLITADAKGQDDGGAGVPELRDASDVYARTKEQWKAAILLEHELFSARSQRYGLAGRAFWHPDAIVDGYRDPLIVGMKDEMRNIMRAHRGLVSKLEQMSSMGASYGMSQVVNTQRGDGESVVSTTYRNDIRGNGTVFIGRAGDAQAASLAAQDFGVNLDRLPKAKGWWYIKSGHGESPLVPARIRMYPTRDEVQFQPSIEAPLGTVDSFLQHVNRATLHPQDAEIVEKWRPEFDDRTATPAAEPVGEVRHLTVVERTEKQRGEDKVRACLAAADRPLSANDIATATGLAARTVREILGRLEPHAAEQVGANGREALWRKAA